MSTPRNPNKVYKVRFINPEKGFDSTVKVKGDEYILEAALSQGVDLPVSCNAGACTTCAVKLKNGEVDQDHFFLKSKEIDAGFVLACKAYAVSDCTLITHQEQALLDL